MKHVRDILRKKGNEIWSVSPADTVFSALQTMAEKNIGAVLVMENEKIVGIMSERDYARKVALSGKTSKDVPVSEIMTSDVLYVTPDETLEDCTALMTDKHVRHLPVLENEKLIGIISIGDIVNGIIAEKKHYIKELEHYIHGKF